MSQKKLSGHQFTIDLIDDDDDLDFPSDDEVSISEDQRIMEEFIEMDRERERKSVEKLRRSQTEENTFINSGKNIFNCHRILGDKHFLLAGGGGNCGVIDENTLIISKRLNDNIQNSIPPKIVPRIDMEKASADKIPRPLLRPNTEHGDEPISLAQIQNGNGMGTDDSGIVKCKTCDFYFKIYKKPEYNEIDFKDGDLHCDNCFNRIVSEKSEAWKLAYPAGGGIISTKKRFKVPLKLEQKKENVLPLGDTGLQHTHTRTRFSPGQLFIFINVHTFIARFRRDEGF
jgi:hypothetical protein